MTLLKFSGISEQGRTPLAPDLPSLADDPSLRGVHMTVWYVLFASAKVDHEIVDWLSEALGATLHDPEMHRNLMEIQLLNPVGSTPAEFAALLEQEIATYSREGS